MLRMWDVWICGKLGMWNAKDLGCWGCRMFGMWNVGDLGCEMLGIWHVRDVGCGMLIDKMPIFLITICVPQVA